MIRRRNEEKLVHRIPLLLISLSFSITSTDGLAINSFNGNIVGDNSLNNNANQGLNRPIDFNLPPTTTTTVRPTTTTTTTTTATTTVDFRKFLPHFLRPPYGIPSPYGSGYFAFPNGNIGATPPYETGYLAYLRNYSTTNPYSSFFGGGGNLPFVSDNRRGGGRNGRGGRRNGGGRRRNGGRRRFDEYDDDDFDSDFIPVGYLALLNRGRGIQLNPNPTQIYSWGSYTII